MTNIPLIVGGGIKSTEHFEKVLSAGADIVVVGTAFENNHDFFNMVESPHGQTKGIVIE